ncbi:MAG: MarR family transcriptional regulator [Proteobacteria bacterium]|nr:MarR family transcriptional regulator [Pseudomonadota bacterium]
MPTKNVPERTLGLVLHDVARFLRKRFEQRAREAELGLTRAQWSVLAHLARHEGINQAALAQILEIEPITLVRLLDRLQAAGLVERRPDSNDRRARVLYLTPAARPLLDRIWTLAAVVREEAMAGLPEAEREQLFRMLLKIKANLTEPIIDGPVDEAPRQVRHG